MAANFGNKGTSPTLVANGHITDYDPPAYDAYCVNEGYRKDTPEQIQTEKNNINMQTITEKSGGANNLKQFQRGESMCESKYVKTAARSKVKKFYKRQDTEVSGYKSCVQGKDSHISTAEEQRLLRLNGICAYSTLLINIVLVSCKVYSAVTSGSSSVLASLIENFMDVVSNIILIVCNIKVKKIEPYAYPHGKSRIEPIGVMLFGLVMSMTGLMMIMHSVESIVKDLTDPKYTIKIQIRVFDMSLFIATVVIKMICFAVMYRWKTPSIKALSLDHLNDSMVNLVAFIMAFIGFKFWRFADPLGAGLIAILIVFNWIRTVRVHVRMLIGQSAKPKWQRQLLWMIVNHVHDVARPAYLRASTFGESYLVDVGLAPYDSVSCADMAKVSKSLKKKLEAREDVAVAIVCLCESGTDLSAVPAEAQLTPEPVLAAESFPVAVTQIEETAPNGTIISHI